MNAPREFWLVHPIGCITGVSTTSPNLDEEMYHVIEYHALTSLQDKMRQVQDELVGHIKILAESTSWYCSQDGGPDHPDEVFLALEYISTIK